MTLAREMLRWDVGNISKSRPPHHESRDICGRHLFFVPSKMRSSETCGGPEAWVDDRLQMMRHQLQGVKLVICQRGGNFLRRKMGGAIFMIWTWST